MSFTTEVKQEISSIARQDTAKKAELSALIQMCSNLSIRKEGISILIQSENANTAKRIWSLVKERYQIEGQLSVVRKVKFKKNNIYMIRFVTKAMDILEDLEIYTKMGLQPHASKHIVKSEESAKAYLAGAFLASGSVNSPQKANYHLEIATTSIELAKYIQTLMNRFHLYAKVIKRRKQEVVYIKSSDKISDFLRCIGASDAVFTFEDSRIQRDFINSLTRLDNCELANEVKSVTAGKKQLEDILWIENYRSLETLPIKLQQVAALRKKHPEASLNELCAVFYESYNETISKSGMKHRLAKIKELAVQYQKE